MVHLRRVKGERDPLLQERQHFFGRVFAAPDHDDGIADFEQGSQCRRRGAGRVKAAPGRVADEICPIGIRRDAVRLVVIERDGRMNPGRLESQLFGQRVDVRDAVEAADADQSARIHQKIRGRALRQLAPDNLPDAGRVLVSQLAEAQKGHHTLGAQTKRPNDFRCVHRLVASCRPGSDLSRW
jgi:hypothetical protein